MNALRILTFNWHESYLCLLAKTGHDFTAVDKNKGGHPGWLHGTRPVPPNIRLLPVDSEREAQSLARAGAFDLAICHNLRDLADMSGIRIPKIVLFHNLISTEIELFRIAGRPAPTRPQYLAQFQSLFERNTRAVFISERKRADAEGIDGCVILPGIDLDEYGGYRGDLARVLRVGNFFVGRDIMLGQTAAAAALRQLPVTVMGLNPEIPEARLSKSWEDLKEHFRSHRAFLNTTVEGYEDGYNLAMLEAMATGMPVVSTSNRTSPVEEGVNGFVSAGPEKLHECLKLLLDDRDLASKLGAKARETVAAKFPLSRFLQKWNEVFAASVGSAGQRMHEANQTADNEADEIAEVERKAQELFADGFWSRARACLEKQLQDHPSAGSLWKVLGLVYRNLGREPEAIQAFWAAARLDPSDEAALKLHLAGLASIAPGAHPENNPEAAALACLCLGKGVDVGCGPNKTHPDAIGVDLVPAGSSGVAGGVKGLESVANLCASGDDLSMFHDGELDYVVSRHNLEHYQDPLKALEEWKRVLKPGGILGLVLPDDTHMDTIHMDESHKHVFTPDSFQRLMRHLGDFEPIHIGTCLHQWSFTAVYQKQGGVGDVLNYKAALARAAARQCAQEARKREQVGEPSAALECWREAAELEQGNPVNLAGRVKMLRRMGRLDEARALMSDFEKRFPASAKLTSALSGGNHEPAEAGDDVRTLARALMTSRSSTATAIRHTRSPQDPEAKLGRGRIMLSAGRVLEARDWFVRWQEEDPATPFAPLGLGCVALACCEWEEAERLFGATLDLSPEDPRALCGLGLALAHAGRETEATEAFARSLRQDPMQAGTLQALIRAAVSAGRFADALDAVKRFIGGQPENLPLLFSCASLSARLGKADEALRLLDRIEAIQPTYPDLDRFRAAWSSAARPTETAANPNEV